MNVSTWDALVQPSWFDSKTPSDAEQRHREIRSWASCPVDKGSWAEAVFRAMATVEESNTWGALTVYQTLTELKNRGQPLRVIDMGRKEIPIEQLNLPAWLVKIHLDILADGPAQRAEVDAEQHWIERALSPFSATALRKNATSVLGSSSAPVRGAPLPVTLLSGARSFLTSRELLNAEGKKLKYESRRKPVLLTQRLMVLLKWAVSDLTGAERQAALMVGWAAACWFKDHYPVTKIVSVSLQGSSVSSMAAKAHFGRVVEEIEPLLVKHGMETDDQRMAAVRWALEGAWGPHVTLQVAETVAMSWGPSWPRGSEQLWSQSLAVLAKEPETHWNHQPFETEGAVTRHVIRQGISALTNHLALPVGVPAAHILDAWKQHLEPRWITEALAQAWLSSRSASPEHQENWDEVATLWLSQASDEEANAWPLALRAAFRDKSDGDLNERLAQAQGIRLETRWSEPASVHRRRTRL